VSHRRRLHHVNSRDVVVVGAGNAALCAALAAREEGASVKVLEAAPQSERGGNSAFTGGAMRVPFAGAHALRELVPDLTPDEVESAEFGSYSEQEFFADLARVSDNRASPDLLEVLVTNSHPTLLWMRRHGVRFQPSYGRQAFKVDGRFQFWGGLVLEVNGGGPGLVEQLIQALERQGVEVTYQSRALELLYEGGRVRGVRARAAGRVMDVPAGAVVLACGGFEANREWRTRYLGPGWDLAKVRGSRYNIGDGIRMALDVGASPAGHWSGCHAVAWDMNAPEFGDLRVGDGFQKHSYPLGIMVNAQGRRFVDEGADFRNFTYAKYGRSILEQPGQFAWQIFDARVSPLLRDEYRIREVTVVKSESLELLADRLDGVDPRQFLETVRRFNQSIKAEIPFNPNVKDGRGTSGIDPPKTNWANPISDPPFEAYMVTCGITFTFGGLRIDRHARVIDVSGEPIPGLYAAGELVGDLFYFNYPGGSGLTSGAVFGRIAGSGAASLCIAEDATSS
jgi:tricarballylate dehydrogenase